MHLRVVLLPPTQAALAPAQSLERLFHVTAFATSMYNTIKRVQKPFKNLEQSTYELIHLEKGIRCVGEKVAFHQLPWTLRLTFLWDQQRSCPAAVILQLLESIFDKLCGPDALSTVAVLQQTQVGCSALL